MKKIGLAALFVCMCAGIATAQLTDYQLQVSCTGCASGIYTGGSSPEVNGLSVNTITIKENGNGQPTVLDPVLLIIGVPNPPAGFTPPTVTAGTSVGVGPGLAGGAWGWNGSAGATTFSSSSSGDAYSQFGLGGGPSGQNSESFGNWSAANLQLLGKTTSSFSLYVYALSGTSLSGGGSTTATFNSTLPEGTFVIAYSCSGTSFSSGPCPPGNGDIVGATPFTQAGETTTNQVPEPTTLALLGTTGLFGLAGVFRRKRSVQ